MNKSVYIVRKKNVHLLLYKLSTYHILHFFIYAKIQNSSIQTVSEFRLRNYFFLSKYLFSAQFFKINVQQRLPAKKAKFFT